MSFLRYFKQSIAKIILLTAAKNIIKDHLKYKPGLGLFQPSYVYTLSKLSHEINEKGKILNLDSIWAMQAVPEDIQNAMSYIFENIVHTVGNSQLAKRETMWDDVKKVKLDLPDLNEHYISEDDDQARKLDSQKEARLDTQLSAETAIFSVRDGYWRELAFWAHTQTLISPPNYTLLTKISDEGWFPSPKQAKDIINWYNDIADAIPVELGIAANQRTD